MALAPIAPMPPLGARAVCPRGARAAPRGHGVRNVYNAPRPAAPPDMGQLMADPEEYMAAVPSEGELRRTIGPILAALCRAVSPRKSPGKNYKGLLGIDFAEIDRTGIIYDERLREQTLARRMGVHALVYLARRMFGCPGLEPYDFHVSPPGSVSSLRLDLAIDRLESLKGVGGMDWDDGRFAALVGRRGRDHEWLSIAALILVIRDILARRGESTSRNGLLEEAHLECYGLPRRRMSEVYDDLLKGGLL